ncbi:MAG: hypothetical protein ACOWWO_14470 [Peptococcaceae bacterium]
MVLMAESMGLSTEKILILQILRLQFVMLLMLPMSKKFLKFEKQRGKT